MPKKVKKKIVTYDNTLTPVLDDDYVPLTGDVFSDVESANSYLSKSRTESVLHRAHPAVLISSRKITVGQIPAKHKEKVVISLRSGQSYESSESFEVVEHRALVAGFCDFVDPSNVIKELCPIVYEIYVEDEESSLMVIDRRCEVVMLGTSFGVVHNVPTSDIDYVEGGDEGEEKKKSLKSKFKSETPKSFGDLKKDKKG